MNAFRAAFPGIAVMAALVMAVQPGHAADPIRIGEINSYSRFPALTQPYRNGWELAVEEINAAGGVRGRPIEVIARDDSGDPAEAVRIAEELVNRRKVVMLAGTYFSNVGLAVTEFAGKRKVMFMAAAPLSDALTWQQGNHYTFRVRPNTTMQAAMLAEEAAKLPAKRWALIAPNYKFGREGAEAFKAELAKRRPDIEWVAEQWPGFGKIDAGAEVKALLAARPDAIYNVTFGSDLMKFVQEGNLRGLFTGRPVFSLLSGEPEYLDPLGGAAPVGWIVTGYPWYAIDTPEHRKFVGAYRTRFNDYPRLGSVVGYNTFKAIAAILDMAKSTDTEALIAAAENVEVFSPTGRFIFRPIDHQATMGTYVGRTAVSNGQAVMVDWHYVDGTKYLPGDDEIRKLRGQ